MTSPSKPCLAYKSTSATILTFTTPNEIVFVKEVAAHAYHMLSRRPSDHQISEVISTTL